MSDAKDAVAGSFALMALVFLVVAAFRYDNNLGLAGLGVACFYIGWRIASSE